MTAYPGFGVLLAKLSVHRKLDSSALARQSGVPEPELRGVLDGAAPSPSLLRQLAPALDLHAADVFVIAGAAVPDDLAPLDPEAGPWVPGVVRCAGRLTPEKRGELRHLVHSLPQEKPSQRPPQEPSFRRLEGTPPGTPGATLDRMLILRNLHWTGMAKTFLVLTGRYWAASTYGMVGAGRKELTPDLVADFGTVLDVPAGDLATLTGIALPEILQARRPATTGMAELIWDLRRLTADQVRHIGEVAASMGPA
ncbi:hypothetical protein [Streptomyces fructofermentans]|uniref:hypothetical protein n=1 Tax=Streptomyces fructofermentans TaxID=152141 RepID=UPI00167C2FEE|nr:hypothetical protein [Streptomyces fructofermentans]